MNVLLGVAAIIAAIGVAGFLIGCGIYWGDHR